MSDAGAGRFADGIAPATLVGLVRNTAPYLFSAGWRAPLAPAAGRRLIDLAGAPDGWLATVLEGERLPAAERPGREQREDYFALCLACHHASVASYVPTDVDSKIRGACWQGVPRDSLARQFACVQQAGVWDYRAISARWVDGGQGPVGGHDGERLGVLAGALGGFIAAGDDQGAAAAAAAIDAELEREAEAFRRVARAKGAELDLLRLAAILTHNVGDIDQGISYWPAAPAGAAWRARFARLAHENATPHGGTFQLAAELYRRILAAEGHRHYPLRAVKALRASPDFLLPFGPFLDAWGERLASHPDLDREQRAEILGALLAGCRKIPGQVGYHRAIAGMARGCPLDELAKRLPGALRSALKDPEVRRHLALAQVSFESSLRKQALAILAGSRR